MFKSLLNLFNVLIVAKQKCYTPKSRKTYYGKYYSAHQAELTSEKTCHQVKVKKTDRTPVNCTYDNKNQCDYIQAYSYPVLEDGQTLWVGHTGSYLDMPELGFSFLRF